MTPWIDNIRDNVSKLKNMQDLNTRKINNNLHLFNLIEGILEQRYSLPINVSPEIKKQELMKIDSSQNIDPLVIHKILETTAMSFDVSIKLDKKIQKFRDIKKPQNISKIQL